MLLSMEDRLCMRSSNKILLSNGHSRFILAKICTYLESQDLDYVLLNSFYPKKFYFELMPAVFLKWAIVIRFFNRSECLKREEKIINFALSEIPHQIAVYLFKKNNLSRLSKFLAYLSMLIYRWMAALYILFSRNLKIYHFRSGYGGLSLRVARWKGIHSICDQSFVNPEVLNSLVESKGSLSNELRIHKDYYWNPVSYDLKNSDLVICNSQFVEDTVKLSNKNIKTRVLYNGLDSKFRKYLDNEPIVNNKNLVITFMGSFEQRKGADVILNSLVDIFVSYTLHIIGSVDSSYAERLPKNIIRHGYLSLDDSAKILKKSDIFLFPSLAEGSARVVYMALASGCYVITTPNSGSIVEDGVTGRLLPAGRPDLIAKEINCYPNNLTNALRIRINAKKTASSHENSEEAYLTRVLSIYKNLRSEDL